MTICTDGESLRIEMPKEVGGSVGVEVVVLEFEADEWEGRESRGTSLEESNVARTEMATIEYHPWRKKERSDPIEGSSAVDELRELREKRGSIRTRREYVKMRESGNTHSVGDEHGYFIVPQH